MKQAKATNFAGVLGAKALAGSRFLQLAWRSKAAKHVLGSKFRFGAIPTRLRREALLSSESSRPCEAIVVSEGQWFCDGAWTLLPGRLDGLSSARLEKSSSLPQSFVVGFDAQALLFLATSLSPCP